MDHPVLKSEHDLSCLVVVGKDHRATLIDLQDAGFQAEAIDHRYFSCESLCHQHRGVVVLDLSLPIKIAAEVCHLIKSRAAGPDTSVLLLLNRPDDYSHLAASPFRPDHYLIEPFTLADLCCEMSFLLHPAGSSLDRIEATDSEPFDPMH